MTEKFIKWCENTGNKPNDAKVLKEFMTGVENGTLVECAVCGEYNHIDHMTRARFDYDKDVCESCRKDGN